MNIQHIFQGFLSPQKLYFDSPSPPPKKKFNFAPQICQTGLLMSIVKMSLDPNLENPWENTGICIDSTFVFKEHIK